MSQSGPELIKDTYPLARRDATTVTTYFGTEVADPYRWLEQEESEETNNWVLAQNVLTEAHLSSMPARPHFKQRLTKLWDHTQYYPPRQVGTLIYYFKKMGLQNQPILYRVDDTGKEAMVLDPNAWSQDGTASVGQIAFSRDGTYLAYLISESGSDWQQARILDLNTMLHLDEALDWIKFSSIAWHGEGFYYSRYPQDSDSGKLEHHALYYHELYTSQDKDRLIYGNPSHPRRNVYGMTTEDERFLIVSEAESTSGNSLLVMNLSEQDESFRQVFDGFEHDYHAVGNSGSQIYCRTNADAPNQKLIVIDTSQETWPVTTVIDESEDVLENVTLIGGKLVVLRLSKASHTLAVSTLSGKTEFSIDLPCLGSIPVIRGRMDRPEFYYAFTSFTYPLTVFKADVYADKSQLYFEPTIDFDVEGFEVLQEWSRSRDGTMVPYFRINRKGLSFRGDNACLLYGYGGFNVSLTPAFSIGVLPFLEEGGVYVVANTRGGGEFGKAWHLAGTKSMKQNVFDDFIGVAETLIERGVTSTEHLAIRGGSNGGLLVGACMLQRPDLFRVVLPAVGVFDMLRYQHFTIGWAWATDYGLSSDENDFHDLIKYSPVHNVRPETFPATLVTTADHDDRVVPAHSYKFVAELQHHQQGSLPILIRIETSAGHGAGKPVSKLIDEQADILTFMMYFTASTNRSYVA